MKMRVTLLVMVVLTLLLAGCSQATEIKPPTIRYGEDKCADCDMIINDERFAAAAIREISAGDYESLLFDDIGDLVRYLTQHKDQTFVASYVHDYDTKAWIEAEKAVYVDSDTLKTPMATGLAASSSQGGAEALAAQWNGKVMDWEAVKAQGGTMRHGGMGGMGGSNQPTPTK